MEDISIIADEVQEPKEFFEIRDYSLQTPLERVTARIQSLTSAWIDDYVTGICNGEFVAEHISAPSSLAGIRSYRRHALLASDVILCQPGSPARIAEDHLSFPSPQLVFFALDPDDTLVDSHPLLRNLLDSSLDFDAELDSIVHSFGMTHFVLVEIPKGLRFDVKSTRSGKTMHYSWDEIDDENEDSNFSTPVSRFPCSPLDSYPTLSFFASALSSALHWIADDIFLEEEDLSQEVKSTLDGDVERRKVLLKRSLLSSLSYFVRPLSTPTEQFPTLFGRCFAISLNHPEWIPQPLSEDFSPLPEWKDAISSLSHSSHVVDAEFFDEKISVVPAHCTHLSGLLELLSLRIGLRSSLGCRMLVSSQTTFSCQRLPDELWEVVLGRINGGLKRLIPCWELGTSSDSVEDIRVCAQWRAFDSTSLSDTPVYTDLRPEHTASRWTCAVSRKSRSPCSTASFLFASVRALLRIVALENNTSSTYDLAASDDYNSIDSFQHRSPLHIEQSMEECQDEDSTHEWFGFRRKARQLFGFAISHLRSAVVGASVLAENLDPTRVLIRDLSLRMKLLSVFSPDTIEILCKLHRNGNPVYDAEVVGETPIVDSLEKELQSPLSITLAKTISTRHGRGEIESMACEILQSFADSMCAGDNSFHHHSSSIDYRWTSIHCDLGVLRASWKDVQKRLPPCAPPLSLWFRFSVECSLLPDEQEVEMLYHGFVEECRARWEACVLLPFCPPGDPEYVILPHAGSKHREDLFSEEHRMTSSSSLCGIEDSHSQSGRPPHPDWQCSLLHQKCMMLNCCIDELKNPRNKENRPPLRNDESENKSFRFHDGWDFDLNEIGTNDPISSLLSSSPLPHETADSPFENETFYDVETEEDILAALENTVAEVDLKSVRTLESGDPLIVPKLQDHPPLTEDMAVLQQFSTITLASSSPTSAVPHLDMLERDMQAFKAANPSATFRDFIFWHSPADIVEDGKLSCRMMIPDNPWIQTWERAIPIPAEDQKPVFDPIREAACVVHFLEHSSRRYWVSRMCLQNCCSAAISIRMAAGPRGLYPYFDDLLDSFCDGVHSIWSQEEEREISALREGSFFESPSRHPSYEISSSNVENEDNLMNLEERWFEVCEKFAEVETCLSDIFSLSLRFEDLAQEGGMFDREALLGDNNLSSLVNSLLEGRNAIEARYVPRLVSYLRSCSDNKDLPPPDRREFIIRTMANRFPSDLVVSATVLDSKTGNSEKGCQKDNLLPTLNMHELCTPQRLYVCVSEDAFHASLVLTNLHAE